MIFVGRLLQNQNDDQNFYIQAVMQLQERGLKNIRRVAVAFVPR
jgi:hypothetical protein